MAYSGSSSGSYADLSAFRSEGREPGARRKKLAGYLKAANELRQSYMSGDGTHYGSKDGSDDMGIDTPGAFPDAAVVRNGNEEMILFPSYARQHVKSKVSKEYKPGRRHRYLRETSLELSRARYKRFPALEGITETRTEPVMQSSGGSSGTSTKMTVPLSMSTCEVGSIRHQEGKQLEGSA